MLLQSFSGHVQWKVIRVDLAKQSPLDLTEYKNTIQAEHTIYYMVCIFQPAGTHHSLDKVQVLGHHVVEVVCDEDSSDKQLGNKHFKINATFKDSPLNSPWTWFR